MSEELIQILALTKNEQRALAAFSKHPLQISTICKSVLLPRTTVYRTLQSLKDRGFIERVKKGKRWYWMLKSHHKISRAFAEASRELGHLQDPVSKTIFSTGTTAIRIHQGSKSIFKIWEEIASLPRHSRVYAIQPERSYNLAIQKNLDTVIKVNDGIRKNKVIVEAIIHELWLKKITGLIGTANAQRLLESFRGRLADTETLPDDFLDVESEMYLVRDTLYITDWRNEIAISIRNADLAILFKGLFDSLKFTCKKYDQQDRIARKVLEIGSKQ